MSAKTKEEIAPQLVLLAFLDCVANGGRQVEAALGLSIPGLASASLKLAIGERPVGTSWVTVGQVGASVHTAQTRLLLTVLLGPAMWQSTPLAHLEKLQESGARLSSVYGQTETTGMVTYTAFDAPLPLVSETIGRPIRGVEIRNPFTS